VDGLHVLSESQCLSRVTHQLLKRLERNNGTQFCFTISQLSVFDESVEAVTRNEWYCNQLFEYLVRPTISWGPFQLEDTFAEDTDYLLVAFASPYSLLSSPSLHPFVKQLKSILQYISKIERSCEEAAWVPIEIKCLNIVEYLTTHLNHFVQLEDHFQLITMIEAMQESHSTYLDEAGYLRTTILDRSNLTEEEIDIQKAEDIDSIVLVLRPELTNREWIIPNQSTLTQRLSEQNNRERTHLLTLLCDTTDGVFLRVPNQRMKLESREEVRVENRSDVIDQEFSSTAVDILVKYLRNLGLNNSVTEDSFFSFLKHSSQLLSSTSLNDFDWFASFVYLFCQCDRSKASALLKNLLNIPESCFMWFSRGNKRAEGIHPVNVIAKCADYLLQTNYEWCSNMLKLRGISVLVLVHRWLQQFFIGYLTLIDTSLIFTIVLSLGIDYLVYFVTILVKELATSAREDVMVEELRLSSWIPFLRGQLPFSFSSKHLNEMKALEKQNRTRVMKILQDFIA